MGHPEALWASRPESPGDWPLLRGEPSLSARVGHLWVHPEGAGALQLRDHAQGGLLLPRERGEGGIHVGRGASAGVSPGAPRGEAVQTGC